MNKLNRNRIQLLILVLGCFLPVYSQPASVGSPKASFAVSNTGAATYSVDIDVPNGGKLTPNIGVAYSSQSGYDLVGYGFGITGLSSITRGKHDLYHDGSNQGITYSKFDAYYIDGVRLIRQSGIEGSDGTVYTPEGNPYTKVIAHGDASTTSCWFEVHETDGITYKYGETSCSRLVLPGKDNSKYIAEWHICSSENQYGDRVTYSYRTSENLCLMPTEVTYGINKYKDRGICNKIIFSYSNLGNKSIPFAIGSYTGKIDVKLTSIETSTNNKTYRKYYFNYDNYIDGSHYRFPRLVNIEERNGEGERYNPIVINWEGLPNAQVVSSVINLSTKDGNSKINETFRTFLSADINNDGISDIIRFSSVESTDRTNFPYSTYMYVSLSHRDGFGQINFGSPARYPLGRKISEDYPKAQTNCPLLADFDGDGYNDIIAPFYKVVNGKYYEEFQIFYGKDLISNVSNMVSKEIQLTYGRENPLLLPYDIDGDGKAEITYIEKQGRYRQYRGGILKPDHGNLDKINDITFQFDSAPDKVFIADYNSDGLEDFIFFYKGGYKIYYNTGCRPIDLHLSESNTGKSVKWGDCFCIEQGDFNGDGRQDFIYYESKYDFNLAINNGNGTFTLKPKALILKGMNNQTTSKDDDKFNILVYDIDHDGRSDIVATKATYEHHENIFHEEDSYKNTTVKWIYSASDSSFIEDRSTTFVREEDAKSYYFFYGDFDGDGFMELANYGSDLYNGDISNTDIIHVYHSGGNMAEKGRISSFTDGYGCTTKITYLPATNPDVYTQKEKPAYPVNSYTLPVALVSKVVTDNGAAGKQTINYEYGDLKYHLGGKGVLGFSKTVVYNKTLDKKEIKEVTKWDETWWIPSETKKTITMGGNTSSEISSTAISKVGFGNYLTYISDKEITDFDGNKTHHSEVYNTEKGVLTEKATYNNADMYKKTTYSEYINKSGIWLPARVEYIQKHEDDAETFSSVTSYIYDEKGNVVEKTENSTSSLPLTTAYTHDNYGNLLSAKSSGSGVTENTIVNSYDTSGRFVTLKQETASSKKHAYIYDIWGNLLTESEKTDEENVNSTQYQYDGWGNETGRISPEGITTTRSMGWGTSADKKYYILTQPSNTAWVKTWYDACGREVLSESVGLKGIAISRSTKYDSKGFISKYENKTGILSITETFTHDYQGRVLKDKISSGKTTDYIYGNRSITAITSGKSYIRYYDAWGNVVKSTDPIAEVSYMYNSNGKPSAITSCGISTYFEYDDCGNEMAMSDPDAGITSYTYSADGKLITQTDARGIITTNSYDDKGRVVRSITGNTSTEYFYGTTGNECDRLKKSIRGDMAVEYTYDNYGRLATEKRTIADKDTILLKYHYNKMNLINSIDYPGEVNIGFGYDDYGNKTVEVANGMFTYKIESYDGQNLTSSFMNSLTSIYKHDNRGFENFRTLQKGSKILEKFSETYDGATGNLTSRQRNSLPAETFFYDDINRLISVRSNNKNIMEMTYENNGNIESKSQIGNYEYNPDERPHAVTSVENTNRLISGSSLSAKFNDFNKVEKIHEDSKGYDMTILYGPDNERWYSILTRNGKTVRSTIYAGNYEKITEDGDTREFYYADGNAIVVRRKDKLNYYLSFTDNLGSILTVVDKDGKAVFDASYDAWGGAKHQENN